MIVILRVNLYLAVILRNVFPDTTETMNISGKMRAISRWYVLLAAVAFCGKASAQDWQEYSVVNQGVTLNWSFTVLYTANSTLLPPDPSLGTVTTEIDGSKLSIDFIPVVGAVGTAEFIIEHFSGSFPPTQVTSAYRIFIDSSHVFAVEDYAVVEVNTVDNSLNVLANDSLAYSDSLTITNIVVSPVGNAEIAADGKSILFTPEVDFTGVTFLTYVACDELGACGFTDVNIGVVPDGGFALLDTLFLSTNNKTPVIAYLPISGFGVSVDPGFGSVVVDSNEAWVVYTPDDSYVGVDSFTLTADTLTRVVVIDVYYQDAPNSYVVNDVYYTRIDSTIVFDPRDNDVKAFPIHAYTEPDKGEVTVDELGVFTYTPDLSFVGAVEFSYDIRPLNNLETGNIIIYIGDMPPDNTESYDLITPKNTQLILNYQIPLDDYNLILTLVDPTNGLLDLWNGDVTLEDVGCDPISGYDLMVYTPDENFIGLDSFEIEYCVVNGSCDRVKIKVDVQDLGDLGDCVCIDGCVWPGDADGSGQVDMADLLMLGWHVGEKGASRDYMDNTNWLGQYADDWLAFEGYSGINGKYVDGNGDGVISEIDTQVIYDHYLLRHALIPEVTGLKADYEFTIIPPSGPLDSGDLAVFEIAIGNATNPVLNMHGIYFSLNLPTELYQQDSVDIQFENDGWLGYDAANFQMHMEPWHGRLDVGFTRTNGTSATGAGMISIMTFIVVDDFDGFYPPGVQIPFNITAYNIGSMGSDGQIRSLQHAESTMYYRTPGDFIGDRPLIIDDRLHVFPNPVSNDLLKAHLNGDRYIERLEIYDMQGTLRAADTFDTKQAQMDVSGLPSGSYVLRVIGSDGVVSRKFEVIR
jgi:Secretion system C-terminal sorting domain/Bacterial Ig domain